MTKVEKIKKYPCIESTLDFSTNNYKIRLWVNELRLKDMDRDIYKKLKSVRGSKNKIINWCAKNIPNINAVQVIDRKGRGIVAYTVDFIDDPHG